MKIAVTGGTGFIGRNLVDRLVAEGHQVNVLTHSDPAENLFGEGVTMVKGSVEDTDSLVAAFDGAEVVYHLVGIIVETKTKTFEGTVVAGTRKVVEACRRSNVRKIIYLSAMGTSEDAPTEYHRTKYLAEQTIKASDLDWTIYRPSLVYGLGDGFVSMLKKMIERSPITPVIGNGRFRLQPVYIDDLISALVQGPRVERARKECIEIGGPEELEYLEILNIIKRGLGKKRPNIHVPMWVMKSMAAVLEKIMRPAPVTRDQLIMMEMGNTGDISKMKSLFAIEPVKFEHGLSKYLRWENG